ncbi:MAG: phospholipid-binding protein MlaC [Comamonas sp.]
MMQRRTLVATLAATSALWLAAPAWSQAAIETPDALVKRLSSDVLETIKADPELRNGNIARISQVVDSTVMPHVNFRRMTSAAVGPQWRQATPEQRERLQQEFKLMLIRTYAGALKQVSDQRVVVKPLRAAADDKDVLVRTEVHGKGEPVQLDFRLENADGKGWKIYNLNVLGVWMVETYRTQFAQELNKGGIDGLINALSSRTIAADAKNK